MVKIFICCTIKGGLGGNRKKQLFCHFRNVSFQSINVSIELIQKDHIYIPVRLFEKRCVCASKWTACSCGSVNEKLFTQTALCKFLCWWQSSSSVWECFLNIFPFMWWRIRLCLLCRFVSYLSLCELAETSRMETFRWSFMVLFFWIFPSSCGRSLPACLILCDGCWDQNPVVRLRAKAWPMALHGIFILFFELFILCSLYCTKVLCTVQFFLA